jgi:hypothetical protein
VLRREVDQWDRRRFDPAGGRLVQAMGLPVRGDSKANLWSLLDPSG